MNIATESVRAEGVTLAHRCLDSLHDRIGPQKFNAWFRHGTRLTIDEANVKVAVPNPFVANWIETHYSQDVFQAVEQQTGRSRPVIVLVDPSLSGRLRKSQLNSQAVLVARAASGRERPRSAPETNLRHKLEDYVVGAGNRLAHSAALAVAKGGRPVFNPLFIHGSCGVGKTHLLQGLCNAAAAARAEAGGFSWRYVTGEQFTNEFITALRQKKIGDFRARYRKLDLLVVDDVHFLSAKKATQDEFLHTFNTLESAGNQIVMASDAHPKLVGELNEQLVSRFVAGMVVKIEPPDLPTRMEILRRKAAGMNLAAPEEVLRYIAMHLPGSVRELEGALIKLAAVAGLENGPITLALVNQTLADHLARAGSSITAGDVEATAATFFGITPADIHSSRRTRTVSVARMVTMFLARRHTRMSYPEIGRFLGKNHSSVVLGVQRMEKVLAARGQLEWMTPAGSRSMPASQVVELLTEQFS